MHERRDLKKLHTGFKRHPDAPKKGPKKLRVEDGKVKHERRVVNQKIGMTPDYRTGKPVTYPAEYFFVNDLEKAGEGNRHTRSDQRMNRLKRLNLERERKPDEELLAEFTTMFKQPAKDFIDSYLKASTFRKIEYFVGQRRVAVFLRELGFENTVRFIGIFRNPKQAGRFLSVCEHLRKLANFVQGIGSENMKNYIRFFGESAAARNVRDNNVNRLIKDAKRVLNIP